MVRYLWYLALRPAVSVHNPTPPPSPGPHEARRARSLGAHFRSSFHPASVVQGSVGIFPAQPLDPLTCFCSLSAPGVLAELILNTPFAPKSPTTQFSPHPATLAFANLNIQSSLHQRSLSHIINHATQVTGLVECSSLFQNSPSETFCNVLWCPMPNSLLRTV